jgi:HTH-type transcriptional regulator/antitoxin HigA
MTSESLLAYEAAMAPHPGETVGEYLEFNGWSQRDLARRTGLTPKTISEICSGKAPITPPTSLSLEKVFRRPAHFWLNLQLQFDEAQARRRAAIGINRWEHWARQFPLEKMERYGWLEIDEPGRSKADTLLSFLGVSSPDSWDAVWNANNVAYRQTRKFRKSPEAISAWVRAAELMALQLDFNFNEFDADGLRACLPALRHQTKNPADKFIPAVQSMCARVGVAVVWVPELPHTGISGCARWLNDKKALIALTLRYKTDDQVWFTFLHEVGHILLHRRRHGFILDNAAEDLADEVVDPVMQRDEEEANRFAADTLIPPDSLSDFIKKNEFSNEAILGFSDRLDLGPGVLVGRLQREGLLGYHQGNKLKRTFKWAIAPAVLPEDRTRSGHSRDE